MSHHRIALLVDLDNAVLSAEKLNLQHCRRAGLWVGPLVAEVERVVGGSVEQRLAYGNVTLRAGRVFRDNVYNGKDVRDRIALDTAIQTQLGEHGFRVVHTDTHESSGKNAADILLSLDAVEIAARSSHIDVFAILSHDADFSPLVHRLRAMGRAVALVTVGEPQHRGMAALRAMVQWEVPYEQRLIDRFGYDALSQVVDGLRSDPSAPLARGVDLGAVATRLRAIQPTFEPELLGFPSFARFLEECLPDGLALDQGRLKGTAPAPGPELAATPAPVGREAALGAALRRVGFHPRVQDRPTVAKAVRELLDLEPGAAPVRFGDLQDRLVADLSAKGLSKGAIRDVLGVYLKSGALVVSEDAGLVDAEVIRFLPTEESRSLIGAEACRRLAGGGEIVLDTDVPVLARLLFGASETAFVAAIRSGMAAALSPSAK